MKRSTIALALSLAVFACGESGSSPSPSGTASSASPLSGASASASASTAPAPPRPTTGANTAPAKVTGAIRDNSTLGEFKDGAALEVRLFVSKITPKDPLHIALQLRSDKPIDKDHPFLKEVIDAGEVVTMLRFDLVTPDGKKVLETSEKLASGTSNLAWLMQELSLDGAGASQFGKTAAWKKPAPDLFAKPGKYTVAVSGHIKTSTRSLAVASKPLDFEIVEASPDFKSLADLGDAAASLVQAKKSLKQAPDTNAAVIDDTDGNRWYRYQLADAHGGYDAEMVEVSLDPAGKEVNFDSFVHFTCIAEGVRIATPSGPVLVQRLAPGDTVVAYDVDARAKTTAVVESIQVGHGERLFAFGDLRVTGAHPVFADGHFQPAAELTAGARLFGEDQTTFPALPLTLDVAATVYELSVSAPHTYFAGGALVHNKAVYEPVGGQQQPWKGWFYRRAATH